VVDPENVVDPLFNFISGRLDHEMGAVPYSGNTNMETQTIAPANDGAWHCMIAVMDASSLKTKIYIDDVDVTQR
jgi:hypothetical protein